MDVQFSSSSCSSSLSSTSFRLKCFLHPPIRIHSYRDCRTDFMQTTQNILGSSGGELSEIPSLFYIIMIAYLNFFGSLPKVCSEGRKCCRLENCHILQVERKIPFSNKIWFYQNVCRNLLSVNFILLSHIISWAKLAAWLGGGGSDGCRGAKKRYMPWTCNKIRKTNYWMVFKFIR